jgi:transcriptional regulator with XRE-family HTH domain
MGRTLANEQLNDSDILVALGKKLRERRRQLGLTQEEVARASGVSRVTLLRVEKGMSSVSAGALVGVAQALGTTLGLSHGLGNAVPEKITPGDYSGLQSLGWQLSPKTVLAPYEAWSIYARNWRHLNREDLDEHETRFLEALEQNFGRVNGV